MSDSRDTRPQLWTFTRGAPFMLSILVALLVVLVVVASAARANETVVACGAYPNRVFAASSAYGMAATADCPGSGFDLNSNGKLLQQGQGAIWQANAPAGLLIVGASVEGLQSWYVNVGSLGDFGGDFYWQGGSSQITELGNGAPGFAPLASHDFGFLLVCGKKTCPAAGYTGNISVTQIALYVQETVGPNLVSPDGLWQSSGWVRGDWNLHFYGDSPSGLCSLVATINGQVVAGSSSPQDTTVWHQCSAPAISQTIHTEQDGQGAAPLTISASDASGVPASDTKTIYIDNTQPTISLSGPRNAPSTAGTQYVTGTAAAGPSGVDGISCSVDGAPAQWYPGASAQVPVAGLGEHTVQCSAANNAVDQAGNHSWSSPATWALKIGEPTISGITFGSRLLDALRCKRVTVRVRVKSRWVTVDRHGRRVRIRRRGHVIVRYETRCHPRVVIRTVRVRGRVERRRVVLLPHTVQINTKRVGYGRPASVAGWTGMSDGTALAGVPVQVITATDNGRNHWRLATVATTAANGTWKATLKPGPSRLIAAVYPGSASTEAATSASVTLRSSTKVSLSIRPRLTVWGHTIRISGRVLGGNIPTGKLLRLRIGTAGIYSTVGIPNINRHGRFATTWTFAPGNGTVHYWFSVSTLSEADYPYAETSSPRVYVTVHR